jgi:hypothetical protein
MNNKMTVKLIIKNLTNYSKNIDEKNDNLIFRELANNIMNSYPYEEYEESDYEESDYEESDYEDKPTFPEK